MSELQIDVNREDSLQEWADKLDVTPMQVKESVEAVGPLAADVEQHLKGVRSTTNSERTEHPG